MGNIICYLSPNYGVGNTSSCISVSSYISNNYKFKNIITDPKYSDHSLERLFIDEDLSQRNLLNFNDIGFDACFRLLKCGELNKVENFDPFLIELINSKLYLLAGSRKIYKDLFFKNQENLTVEVLNQIKRYFDLIHVDIRHGMDSATSEKIIENSDVVIITLYQNKRYLLDYFKTAKELKKSLEGKKVIYIFGKYDMDSKYNIKYIKRKFQIKEPIFFLPYCTIFNDSMNSDSILDFLTENSNNQLVDVFNYQLHSIVTEILFHLDLPVDSIEDSSSNKRRKFFRW